jgi:speckle-type POZ protein
VAAYLVLKTKENDICVRAYFQLSLVDVTGSTLPHTIGGKNEFRSDNMGRCGDHTFMKRSELEGSPYLHDGRLTIECLITIAKDVKSLPEVSSSDSIEQLGKLLQEKEKADVVLDVGGKAFPAHKIMLAMGSPVFKAELYGAMREKDMDWITISDMRPVVFEALLHFIYTDSLPAMPDLGRSDYHEIIKHLLVAADRYAMERLKIVCESILCKNIDVKTVVSTLVLADQHHGGSLKDACVQCRIILNLTYIEL